MRYEGDGIVGGICLRNDWSIWNPMDEDRSRGGGVYEVLEDGVTEVTEVLRNTFTGEMGQRSDITGVVIYEMPVKICEAEEGLYILDLPRLEPVLYGLHLLQGHGKFRG